MKNKKKLLAVLAICVAVGVVAVSFMGMMPSDAEVEDSTDADSLNRTVVETTTPQWGDITVSASFVGTVEPGQSVTVYPKAAGEVLLANFSVGDTVEAGQVLFQIDSTTLEYNIAQTQASLATAEASAELQLEMAQQTLEDYISGVDDGLNSSLIQAESAVVSAEAGVVSAEAAVAAAEISLESANNNYRIARNNYNNYQLGKYYETNSLTGEEEQVPWSDSTNTTLRNAQIAAELQVDTAQLNLESAKTSLENANIGLETAMTSLESVQKSIAEGAVSAQNGVRQVEISSDLTASYIALEQMQTTLADYTVTAPISGVIEARNVDPFDMVSTGTASYVISNVDALTVSFNVTESSLSYMQLGDTITVEKNGQTTTGTVSEISTAVTSGGLYTVKATITSSPFSLHSGSTVKLYADTQKVENSLLVPIDAVYYDNGTAFVYLFQNNTAVRQDIVTGISDDDYIHVESGLTGNEELIVTWSAGLFDGAEVYLPGTVPAASADDGDAETDNDDASVTSEETAAETEDDEADSLPADDGEEASEQETDDSEDRGDDVPDAEAEEEAE